MKRIEFKTNNSIGHYVVNDDDEILENQEPEPLLPGGMKFKKEEDSDPLPIEKQILQRDYVDDVEPMLPSEFNVKPNNK